LKKATATTTNISHVYLSTSKLRGHSKRKMHRLNAPSSA